MSVSLNMITVRPEQTADEPFLFELYSSTRQEELDAWGWPTETRTTFLCLQFKASQGYHTAFPDAEFQIIMLHGVDVGRMIVHRTQEELHLVDIALLPQHRNTGIGTIIMRRIIDEAKAAKRPLRLQVLKEAGPGDFIKSLALRKLAKRNCTWKWSGALPWFRGNKARPDGRSKTSDTT